jgi:ubiquinone/menaquinone biosynthesis C-methylase UbiE
MRRSLNAFCTRSRSWKLKVSMPVACGTGNVAAQSTKTVGPQTQGAASRQLQPGRASNP